MVIGDPFGETKMAMMILMTMTKGQGEARVDVVVWSSPLMNLITEPLTPSNPDYSFHMMIALYIRISRYYP